MVIEVNQARLLEYFGHGGGTSAPGPDGPER
jgi:hypothetical protein